MDKNNPTSRESDKFMLRLPDGMRAQIADAAKSNKRSMNAEVVARIQESFEQREPVVLRIDLTTDAETRMKEVKDAIDALKPYLAESQPIEVTIRTDVLKAL